MFPFASSSLVVVAIAIAIRGSSTGRSGRAVV